MTIKPGPAAAACSGNSIAEAGTSVACRYHVEGIHHPLGNRVSQYTGKSVTPAAKTTCSTRSAFVSESSGRHQVRGL